MPKTRYTAEERIQHLRTVELDTGTGLAVPTPAGSSASPSNSTLAGRRNMVGCAWITRNG